MTKQEFLAMSLPYGLVITDEELQEFPILTGIEYTSEQCLAIQGDSDESDIDSVMPVLHPLSDLTKEIEHNGQKFVPIEELKSLGYIYPLDEDNFYNLPYGIVVVLLKWHFDIANLIEQGEAIDVNTLEINPYV